jgi:malate dehydrogenase
MFRMSEVAIIGAGPVGGELAFLLARQDLAHSIGLVDESGQVAAGKALDIMQASPIESFSTRVSGATDFTTAAGAAVIVLADRFSAGEWQGDDGLLLLRRMTQLGSSSIIICTGPSHHELVERGRRELGIPRGRIIGTAPEALASAVCALTALEANRSPRDVALTVMGRPPRHLVIPWEDATIGGFAATRVLDAAARRRLTARVAHLWPPGPFALAAAAAKAIAAVLGGSRKTMSVFVAPDDSSGRRTRTAALPVRLGPEGMMGVELPELSVHDQVALDNAWLL